MVAEVEDNNLGDEVWTTRFKRWHTCDLCKQDYHGVVRCALGWACWKTYVGRPMKRRNGAPEVSMLAVQSNLACTYHKLGRLEEALQMRRDVYFGRVKIHGEEGIDTLVALNNYALLLVNGALLAPCRRWIGKCNYSRP